MTEVTTRLLRMTSDSHVCVHRGATPKGGFGRRTPADLRCSPGAQSSRVGQLDEPAQGVDLAQLLGVVHLGVEQQPGSRRRRPAPWPGRPPR